MTSGLFNSKTLTYRQGRLDPPTVGPNLALAFEGTTSLAGRELLVEKLHLDYLSALRQFTNSQKRLQNIPVGTTE